MVQPQKGSKVRFSLKAALPWILLSLLLLVPLYAVSVAFAIRSGVFNLSNTTISAEEYQAFWTFVASGLATGASVVGLLFARSHNQRVSSQLELDTAVKGLQLIVLEDGHYAPKARTAGALAALVHLGHPVIAMRTLGAAWEEGAVDTATACWLISEVFSMGTPGSKIEASLLLRHYANLLTHPSTKTWDWPDALRDKWPKHLPRGARLNNVFAVIEVVLSQDYRWWKNDVPGFAIGLLDEAFHKDRDFLVRESAGLFLRSLISASKEGEFPWGTGYKDTEKIRKRLSSHNPKVIWPTIDITIGRIEAWAGSGPKGDSANTKSAQGSGRTEAQ